MGPFKWDKFEQQDRAYLDGVYELENGTLYKGTWRLGLRHGNGILK